MRITGLEPARHGHQNLNLARLPIPPYPLTYENCEYMLSLSSTNQYLYNITIRFEDVNSFYSYSYKNFLTNGQKYCSIWKVSVTSWAYSSAG